MKECLKNYLFNKSTLVGKEGEENRFEVIFALAKTFGINITKGEEYACIDLISVASHCIGCYVPEAFYQGFPRSVKSLTEEERLFDQLLHYFNTYLLGNFSESGKSVFEKDFERLAFDEETQKRDFVIVNEEEAISMLKKSCDEMLMGTRPLNSEQYEVLTAVVEDYGYTVGECNCKDTIIRFLLDTKNLDYAKRISLSDVIKLVDRLNHEQYQNDNIKRLNLKNADRKFISAVIDTVFEGKNQNIIECFEKKAIWCGLLHHIHYLPKCPEAVEFCRLIRGNKNISVYSKFEMLMAQGKVEDATEFLLKTKGASVVLRNLNYIISRAATEKEIEGVVSKIDSKNPVVLLQLLIQYENYDVKELRTFKFPKYGMVKLHSETEEEGRKRRSVLSPDTIKILKSAVKKQLEKALKGKLGNVYVSDGMEKVAVPINESASNSGYGVLPKGTRIPLKDGKKIRCFTYWKEVDDIDLSAIGITEKGKEKEFSWRTMYHYDSEAIVFSGDQTSGYKGGSEFYDIDFDKFKKEHPDIAYLAFCNNVYSYKTFKQCFCKAGYMMRDIEDSGEIFEPSTVESSFIIDCDSTYAYLFAIDLKADEFVWLSLAVESDNHLACQISAWPSLRQYFNSTKAINVKSLAEMMAAKIVTDPSEADVIFTDKSEEMLEGKEIIRSCDGEKIAALLNVK